jgi:flagellar protein FliJ
MKKFVFPLDSLNKVKNSKKDALQAEYSAANAILEAALQRRERLRTTLETETQGFEAKLKTGIKVGEIQAYGSFFEELQNTVRDASKEIERARKEADQKHEELIEAFKEVKILEKLREKQYLDYVDEEEKAENKVLEDILSFNIAEGKTDYTNTPS